MAEAVHRKLTTILSADVEGYSRLMNIDEVSTLERLKTYRQAMTGIIELHRGRVVNTAGDSLLAEFEGVVEAVQCAAEIQRELGARNAALNDDRQMQFRIGVNLGDVMVEGDDLYGEGVNIAARLQGLAAPGGICISGTAYDQVHNKLTLGYDFIGDQSVKNISEEVPVYRVRLDASGHRAGDAVRKPRSDESATTAGAGTAVAARYQEEGQTTRLIYILFVLSLLFGVTALITDDFIEGGRFDRSGGKIEGDATFTEDAKFSGKIGGNVVVAPGVKVKIGGKIGGDVTLGPGATAEVRGKIDGDVINHGGSFRLRGKLGGSERHEPPSAYAGPTASPSKPIAESTVPPREASIEQAPVSVEIEAWVYVSSVVSLLFAITFISGVVIAYVARGDGTGWIDSHYRFQIRTFWIGLLIAVVGGITSIAFIGLVVLAVLPFWLLIRCIRGWKVLSQGRSHPNPSSWLLG